MLLCWVCGESRKIMPRRKEGNLKDAVLLLSVYQQQSSRDESIVWTIPGDAGDQSSCHGRRGRRK